MITDIKSFISNMVIVMPDIGTYFNQNYDKPVILKCWQIANSYKEYNNDKNVIFTGTWKKYCSKAGLNSCTIKLIVEIVSIDIEGTLIFFFCQVFPKSF